MQAAKEFALVSPEEYLELEKTSEVRHEYIGGVIYAMAGTSEEHNLITGNIFAALHAHLRGKSCRLFTADIKLRLQIAYTDIFYYPDLLVTCDPRDTDRYSKCYPKVLVEVLSEATERTDRGEKFLNYTQIPSLEEYVLVAQDRMEVTIFRRATNWQPELLRQAEQSLQLPSLDFALPLKAIYEGIKL